MGRNLSQDLGLSLDPSRGQYQDLQNLGHLGC